MTENTRPTVVLKTQGAFLPLGIPDNTNSYQRNFSVRPWRMKEERELSELRDKNKDVQVGAYVGMVLATMCTNVGPHDFTEMKMAQKRAIISKMFLGDVFYMYVWLRLDALGKDVPMTFKCPTCSKKFSYTADLETLEVHKADKLEDCYVVYDVQQPFPIRGTDATQFTFGLPRWSAIETNVRSIGAAKGAMLSNSIVSVNGQPMALTIEDIDNMGKRDLEAMTRLLDKNFIGPDLAVEGECPHCDGAFRMPLDWGFDGFFAGSSR